MPRQTQTFRNLEGVRVVTEDRDDIGRLQRRVTEFYPDMQPAIALLQRREVESYTYRVATLDMGDGFPPQYHVEMKTDIFAVTPAPDGVLRLQETRTETLSLEEAMRRESLRPRTEAQRTFAERVRDRLRPRRPPRLGLSGSGRWREPTNPPTVRNDLPRALPHPDPLLARPHFTDPIIVSVARSNFEFDAEDLVSSTNARAFMATAMPGYLRDVEVEDFRQAREALMRSAADRCALEKGCQGFCDTCKKCQLHCTCPKAAPPTNERRIRVE